MSGNSSVTGLSVTTDPVYVDCVCGICFKHGGHGFKKDFNKIQAGFTAVHTCRAFNFLLVSVLYEHSLTIVRVVVCMQISSNQPAQAQ